MSKVLKKCEAIQAKRGKWFIHIEINDNGDNKSISATDLIASEAGLTLKEYEQMLKSSCAVKCPRETGALQKDEWYFPTKAKCEEVCSEIVNKFKKLNKK